MWENVERFGQHDIERQVPCSAPPCYRAVGPGIEGSGLCYTKEAAEILIRLALQKIQEGTFKGPEDDSDEPAFRP